MNISLGKIVAQIDRCLPDNGETDLTQLHRIYNLTIRLQSQMLSVIYDIETFGNMTMEKCFAQNRAAAGIAGQMLH